MNIRFLENFDSHKREQIKKIEQCLSRGFLMKRVLFLMLSFGLSYNLIAMEREETINEQIVREERERQEQIQLESERERIRHLKSDELSAYLAKLDAKEARDIESESQLLGALERTRTKTSQGRGNENHANRVLEPVMQSVKEKYVRRKQHRDILRNAINARMKDLNSAHE